MPPRMVNWKWTEEQREILRKLYPTGLKEDIIKAISIHAVENEPPKSWHSIQKEASRLGIKRIFASPPEEFAKKLARKRGRPKKPKTSVGRRQLEQLLAKNPDLTVYEIAQRLKTTPDLVRRYLFRYGL